MKNKIVTIFGAGFIAKNLAFHLLQENYAVRLVCRNPHLVGSLRAMANIDQLDLCQGNIVNKSSIEGYVKNSHKIINTVGVLYEKGSQNFNTCHVLGPKNIAALAKKYRVERLIHISSIGADVNSSSAYQHSKGKGEIEIINKFSDATIVRPSIVFGPEDGFFNSQRNLIKISPFIPLFGGGNNKFQCVYVEDLSLGIKKILDLESSKGLTYEFGGPDILSMRDIYKLIMKSLNVKRLLLPMPLSVAAFMGIVMQCLPSPLITYDQVKMLRQDNVVNEKENTLESIGIKKQSPKDIVPTYIQ